MPEENVGGVKDDGRNPFKEFGIRRVVRVGRGRLEITLVFPWPFGGKVSRLDSTQEVGSPSGRGWIRENRLGWVMAFICRHHRATFFSRFAAQSLVEKGELRGTEHGASLEEVGEAQERVILIEVSVEF